MPNSRPLVAAVITFGSVACAMLLRTVIDQYLHESINYGTFYLAVMVTTLNCGFRWGLASVLISTVTALLVLPPLGHPLIEKLPDMAGLALFLTVASLIVWLCHRVRESRLAAEALALERQGLFALERATREEAERLNRVKDEFLASVSHELRTPLQSILGWAQLLRASQATNEEAAQAIDAIEAAVRMQSQLINDLLDLSRIVMGKLRLDVRPIALSETLHSALQTVLPSARAKNVQLDVQSQGMGPVLGDPDRLQQVIWNLLSNAIKFTPQGGSVRATLRQESESVLLIVSDTGDGIAPEFLPYVFDKFEQAKGERRREGLGLGLAIAKELVELQGGAVQARSDGRGCGAEFRVVLPKHRPSAAAVEIENDPCMDHR